MIAMFFKRHHKTITHYTLSKIIKLLLDELYKPKIHDNQSVFCKKIHHKLISLSIKISVDMY